MNPTLQIIESELLYFFNWLDNKSCPNLVKIGFKLKKIERIILNLLSMESGLVFPDLREEIKYYKFTRPEIFKWHFYYRQIKAFEECLPLGGIQAQLDYIKKVQQNLTGFFKDKMDWFRYWRNHDTRLDHQYFRKQSAYKDIFSYVRGSILFDDYLMRRMIALKAELKEYPGKEKLNAATKIWWSGKKVDLILLAYALFENQSFNGGKTTLKEIIQTFENTFKIDLGDYSRKFIDIQRKHQPTKYLEQLTDKMQKKLSEMDS